MKLRASPRFAPRATAHSPPALCSIFRAAGRPIERLVSPAPPATQRHRFNVCGGRNIFLSRRHREIFAPLYGSIADRVGPLFRCVPAGVYISQSGYPTKNDEDNAAVPASRPFGAAAHINGSEFLRIALSSAR